MKRDFIITKMDRFTKKLKKYLKIGTVFNSEFYHYYSSKRKYIITNKFSMICIEDNSINKYKINILKSTINSNNYFKKGKEYLTFERLEIVYDEFVNYNWKEIDYYKIKETTPLEEHKDIKTKTLKINKYFSIDINMMKECLDLSDTNKEQIKYYTSDDMPVLKIKTEDIEIYMLGIKASKLKKEKV